MAEQYRVSGAIIDKATRRPVPNVTVCAFDRDFWREQPLGKGVTDDAGGYDIRFTRDDFTGPLIRLERHPDLFLRIYDANGRLLRTTEKSVMLNAGVDTRIDVGITIESPAPDDPRVVEIAGERVNVVAAARLTRTDLIEAYRYWRRPKLKPKNIDLVHEAFPDWFAKRDPDDDCGEGTGEAIRFMLRERGDFDSIEQEDLDDFETGATVKSFFTVNVVVKYTTDAGSVDAVADASLPAADSELTLNDGTSVGFVRANLGDLHADNTEVAPTYVQKVGLLAEYALSNWIASPFSLRDPRDGASRMEYRILKQAAGIAGRTNGSWSHVEVDIDNGDSQNSFTVPHELFHQVQYRYNDTTTRSGIYGILREGGARFNVESINDEPNRYVVSGKDIFDSPGESLTNVTTGVKNPIRYAAGLFWKYIAEQHSTVTGAASEPSIGVDTYRTLLEETATVLAGDPGIGYTIDGLRNARKKLPWYGRFDRFRYYDAAKTELDSHETTWCNYLVANHMHSRANPVADSRFEYLEDEDAVSWSAAINKLADLQSAIAAADDLVVGQGAAISRNVAGHDPWAARYYRVTPDATSAPRMLRIGFSASAGLTDPVYQILRIGPGSSLEDLHRSDKANWSKTINMQGLAEVIVIVGTRDTGGDFSIQFDEVASDTDVMVTRWNTALGNEYEIDPRGWSWAWVSPDVMVDSDDDGAADSEVFFDQNNTLKVRLRNRGNVAADNITIDFWYQKATPYLSASAWIPVTNQDGDIQQVTGGTLAAQGDSSGNDVKWFSVDWAPADDGTHHNHWCIKAKVTVPGDPNSDNKLVLSNFSNVVVDDDSDIFQLIRTYEGRFIRELRYIARGPRWQLVPTAPPFPPDQAGPIHVATPCGTALVAPLPMTVAFARMRVVQATGLKPWERSIRESKPSDQLFYPVDPRALPPGVDPEDLVTIVQTIDGDAVGGITYRVNRRG